MYNAGVGAEVAATIQESAFLKLEAPVARVTGMTAHPGLIYEKFSIPDVTNKSWSKKRPLRSSSDVSLPRNIRLYQEDTKLLTIKQSMICFDVH